MYQWKPCWKYSLAVFSISVCGFHSSSFPPEFAIGKSHFRCRVKWDKSITVIKKLIVASVSAFQARKAFKDLFLWAGEKTKSWRDGGLRWKCESTDGRKESKFSTTICLWTRETGSQCCKGMRKNCRKLAIWVQNFHHHQTTRNIFNPTNTITTTITITNYYQQHRHYSTIANASPYWYHAHQKYQPWQRMTTVDNDDDDNNDDIWLQNSNTTLSPV